ncbi:methyl-accepting chemotaxis protein [Parasulfuritortus cantonensis]|uniref:Methyl-accepting chemotaxis protein n=1 Tax=Parasulfuritortus cantonensis TaxID=2528202 RepID=A0A4R1BIQ8_9PROT|nr:methyl-accepting chemotaxis protein [Parasulfuritortus cantonensis]TCJ17215.1 methyl-accepting chemotaxis protein [Parasulfuritortus cantonensis]
MDKPQVNAASGEQGNLGARLSAWQERMSSLDPRRLKMLQGMTSERRYQVLVLTMILSVLLTAVFMLLYVVQVGHRTERVEVASHLQMLSQRYSKTALQAALGNKAAFGQLKESEQAFVKGLDALTARAAVFSGQAELAGLKKRWETSRKDIDTLLTQQDVLVALGQSISQINARNNDLLDLTEQVTALLPPGRALSFAHQQALWTQRMAKNANALVAGEVINPEVAYQLGQDVKTFGDVLNGMLNGDAELGIAAVGAGAARDKLLELKESFGAFSTQVNLILNNMPKLLGAKRAARELFDESEQILAMTGKLTAAYQNDSSWVFLTLGVFMGLAALASLVMLALTNVAESRLRAEQAAHEQEAAARENRRNQEAILRLLNEMGDLADGNLTVRATVTEDITGAIADSVNFAIEELRTLVDNVNRAVHQVTQATEDAKQLSEGMLATTERQAGEIGQATDSVAVMTESVNRVALNASDSAHVAEQSLEFARKGGDSVRAAIAGMNAIRDQIQETSKRIKRLGESSQEIGEIVELIGDITEQTNVLALNAAIQAAAAGEAGRGFSVVAEEVQRLAERSGQATRRIGAIVKTIQTDTQDTINAMEASTRGVVEGATLSDNAGHALQDIESVSDELARLIQSISDATQEQVDIANRIAETMQQVLGQTREAADGARKSAESVGQLTVLADDLRVSVAGFTL